MDQKMKIFTFELESKSDRHFNVKFYGESDGDGPDSSKPYLDPLNGPYWPPMGQKMKIFTFELESKLDRHLDVKFDGESDGDGPDSQKPYLDRPLNGPYRHKN